MKKYKRVLFHDIEKCSKFEEKLTLSSKNGMGNFVNLNVTCGKSESLHFDLLLFSIAYKVSSKKVQKNYLSWHWKKIQIFVWNMTWENWWTLTRAVESLKTCTLMGYFCRKYVMFEQKKWNCVVKNDLYMISKMAYVIWWIFTQVVENNIR